jgi:triacylglycerol lipase
MEPIINLKYPLILVHGAGFRDITLGINYWGRIPRCLAEQGINVYYGNTDAWGSIEKNGELLKQTILDTLNREGAEKVNIIAHSRGGLEARYVISALGMDTAVASLTTMSTPHRGVRVMDLTLRLPAGLYRFVAFFVNQWSKLLGDREPDFFTSSRQLSARLCAGFNRKYPGRNGVYYQSYATKLRYFFGDPSYLFTWVLIKIFDGDNDGLCPVESAKWGNYRGMITTEGFFGISHGGILDLYHLPYKGVDIPKLYVNIVKDLAEKGF